MEKTTHPKLKKYLEGIDYGTLERMVRRKSIGVLPVDLGDGIYVNFWSMRVDQYNCRHSDQELRTIRYNVRKEHRPEGYIVSENIESGEVRRGVPVEPEVNIELNVEKGNKLLSRKKMRVKDGDRVTVQLN